MGRVHLFQTLGCLFVDVARDAGDGFLSQLDGGIDRDGPGVVVAISGFSPGVTDAPLAVQSVIAGPYDRVSPFPASESIPGAAEVGSYTHTLNAPFRVANVIASASASSGLFAILSLDSIINLLSD